MRNTRETLCFHLHVSRKVIDALSDEQLSQLVLLLLTGIDEKYAVAWKLYCGFLGEPQSITAVGRTLGISRPQATYRITRTNDELGRWTRKRILENALEKGVWEYHGNARPFIFLGLSARSINALEAEGIFSIQDMVNNTSDHSLRCKTPNLGTISAEEIIAALKREGVTLNDY